MDGGIFQYLLGEALSQFINNRAMLAALQPGYKHAEPTLIGEFG